MVTTNRTVHFNGDKPKKRLILNAFVEMCSFALNPICSHMEDWLIVHRFWSSEPRPLETPR